MSRTFVITGATSGIGLAAAKELASAGHRVVLAVRSEERGARAAQETGGRTRSPLDLTDLASVREFAESWEGDIDVLINNAGIMAVPEARTSDGFESQIGTNHLGQFALTGLLLGHVRDRVVTLASAAHRMGKIDLADLNWERRPYKRWGAYGQSKLANLLFTLELQRRFEAAGDTRRAFAAHPGYASTNLRGTRAAGCSMPSCRSRTSSSARVPRQAPSRRSTPPCATCPAAATSGPAGRARCAAGRRSWAAARPPRISRPPRRCGTSASG